ncbi:hypothetical protein RRG08_028986 [Elysia crispata]|uniref:Uncharacterized protein n=1 Tax=Elysia crispata TaxID=231223 RepID=A0AAE1BD21_9GAST|nr:hypothetical protein RRG08_028986 [Elysia crispata]
MSLSQVVVLRQGQSGGTRPKPKEAQITIPETTKKGHGSHRIICLIMLTNSQQWGGIRRASITSSSFTRLIDSGDLPYRVTSNLIRLEPSASSLQVSSRPARS